MVNSLKSMRMGLRVLNHSTPSTMSKSPIYIENIFGATDQFGFQVILTNLELHIFTMSPTFHGTSIRNHDLKIIDGMDETIEFLGNVVMNKIMDATTVHKDDDFSIFNLTN
jgi:hypothetical protein